MSSFLGMMLVMIIVVFGWYIVKHLRVLLPEYKNKKVISIIIVGVLFLSVLVNNLMFGFILNIIMFLVLFDITSLLFRGKYKNYFDKVYIKGYTPIVCGILFSLYGMYNAQNIVVKEYDIVVNKQFEDKTFVAISDLHLGCSVDEKDLDNFINEAKSINPDAIFLVGDIYDEQTSVELANYSYDVFKELSKDYTLYYVIGNHEKGYFHNTLEYLNVLEELTNSGVIILDDKAIEVDDYNLIGRIDKTYEDRLSLEDIYGTLKEDKLTILLDHQPIDLTKNSETFIDIQLSGHTHGGQLFPVNIFDTLFNYNDLNYGYKKINDFNTVVSSGMGTWGFAMRTANHSEIVVINVISE